MRRHTFVSVSISSFVWLVVGCDSSEPVAVLRSPGRMLAAKPASSSSFATLILLPTLGGNAETRAVNRAGTVIAGYASERRGFMHPVKWTLQTNGSWTLVILPTPPSSTGGMARGVNDAGDVGGNSFPSQTQNVVLWPAGGGFSILGCGEVGEADAISAGGQVIVGAQRVGPTTATIWRPGSCVETLPGLNGGWASASAVNGDASVVGGFGDVGQSVTGALRWIQNAGTWQVEQLDQRSSAAAGANAAGDLAGYVYASCTQVSGCQRAAIWYRAGGSRELGTLGGSVSYARAINSSGEVIGGSSPATGDNTAFFWSESSGMVALPVNGAWAAAFAISDVRADGSRVVAGVDSHARPIAWIVKNP